MTHRASERSELDLALLPDNVTGKRHHAVLCDRRPHVFEPGRVPYLGQTKYKIESERRIENEFPALNPVAFRMQLGGVKDNLRFLLLEPFHVVRWLPTGCIDRVSLVNGPYRDTVIVLGGNRSRRVVWVRMWYFDRGQSRQFPRLRDPRAE